MATATEHQNAGHGGRCGTLKGLSLQKFAKIFGNPHDHGDEDKVTAQWYFMTPRGCFAVHDYYWNGKEELSIGARCGDGAWDADAQRTAMKVALWARWYFRKLGYEAS